MSEMLTIRRAESEDYDDVMAINTNVYDGLDYLAGLYHTFLANPRNYPYVGLVDGQIVAFMMMYLIDGGTSVISKGNRIKQEYEGKHLFAEFRRKVLVDITTQHQGIKNVVSTTIDRHNVDKLTSRNLMTVISISHKVTMQLNHEPLKQLFHSSLWENISAEHIKKTRVLTMPEVVDVLCSLNPEHFIPEGRWLIHTNPFKPMRSNYETIISDHKATTVIASNPENPSDIVSLTFGFPFKVPFGLKYRISFYYNHKSLAGNQSEIQKHLISHAIKHLILINEMEVKCELHFWLYLEENFDMEPIKYFLSKDLGFDHYTGVRAYPAILCEQNIDSIK